MISMQENVLIASGDSKIVKVFKSILAAEYNCISSGTVREAVQTSTVNNIHLAIIDVNLPDTNGIDALKELMASNEDIATIVLILEDDYNSAVEASRAGAHDFMTKPIASDKIIIRVKAVLERKKRIVEDKLYKVALEKRINTRTKEVWVSREKIRSQFLATISALEKALQARNVYTEGHSRRVARKSVEIAKALSLSKEDINNIELSALFHDIGKIGIRDDVLNKTTKLTDSEYEHMKSHPIVAENILSPIEEMQPIIDVIKHEHERYDGNGYPDGLKGEEIPIGARIVTIADTWDSMVYDRIYRKALSKEEAIAEIERCSGTQFDPQLVKLFIGLETKKIRDKVVD